jgi:spore maturation protein B
MTAFLSTISLFFIPLIITIILIHGIRHKVPVYDLFSEGAKDGITTALDILPFIIAIFLAINSLTSSGAIDWMQNFLSPILNLINIPEELTSLILLRPISGSGSLLLAEEIMREHGVDTLIGRSASVMAGSCETFFYVLALYFGVTSVKKMRHAFIAGLIGYLIGVLMSVYICMII